ncbi:MAG TPA: hypothetical protein VI455_14040 [Terriglobia bacterium]
MGEFLGYLIDVVFLLWMARLLYSSLRRLFASKAGAQGPRDTSSPRSTGRTQGEMARDPVCGMFVSTELSRRLKWKGEVLHFCSTECLEKYQAQTRAS